jgi:(S)-ureidoglycine aminohydrolase
LIPFGTTRGSNKHDHALIVPEGHVTSPLIGWEKTQGIVLISPHIGARFTQYIALLEAGSVANAPAPGVERFVYVMEGEADLDICGKNSNLSVGNYAFIPAGQSHRLTSRGGGKLMVFEKRYVSLPSTEPPKPVVRDEREIQGQPFLGDEDARLQVLLPETIPFDMAVNIFTFKPGATLPFVEVHVMEHGLTMLRGQGVYRLSDSWYPVQAGDTIWMASYCPQWFVASGKTDSSYIYYKDIHRDPLDVAR